MFRTCPGTGDWGLGIYVTERHGLEVWVGSLGFRPYKLPGDSMEQGHRHAKEYSTCSGLTPGLSLKGPLTPLGQQEPVYSAGRCPGRLGPPWGCVSGGALQGPLSPCGQDTSFPVHGRGAILTGHTQGFGKGAILLGISSWVEVPRAPYWGHAHFSITVLAVLPSVSHSASLSLCAFLGDKSSCLVAQIGSPKH